MKKQVMIVFAALMIGALLSVAVIRTSARFLAGVETHSVWTDSNGVSIRDAQTSCTYTTLSGFEMASAWTEATLFPAIAHFRGLGDGSGAIFCTNHGYEFRLVETTYTDKETITGYWNVYRDGSLVCSACDGSATNMGGVVTGSYEVYVDDPTYGAGTWQYFGYIDQRKDF